MSWTEDRVTALKSQWLEGQTAAQIARNLGGGATRNAVISKVNRLGLSNRAAPSRPARTTATQIRALRPVKPVSPAATAPELTLVHAADVQPASAPERTLKTLFERGPRDCCWPVGAAHQTRGQLYCGAPAVKGAPHGGYCADHSPNQPSALREVRFKDDATRRPRREREECDVDLTELLA